MAEIILPEWRNGNQHVRYPFTDTATLVNTNGLTIDPDLFDDARIYPVGGAAGLYLNRIEVTTLGLFFHIADPVHGELAGGGYLFADSPVNDIGLFDQYGRPAGVLVSSADRLVAAAGIYPQGDTVFEQVETEFAPTVAIPIPNTGLRGILLDDGGFISGDIYLVGSDGVVLQEEGGAIRVDIIGDPYALLKACRAEGLPTPAFCGIKTINHIRPNAQGDFKITIGGNLAPETILRITQDDSGNVDIAALGALA
jgi:hypothetical protein